MPERPPNRARYQTNSSSLTIATPDMGSVPTRPTMMLSTMLTKFVIPFWIMIGTAIASALL